MPKAGTLPKRKSGKVIREASGSPKPRTGKELVEALTANGLIGAWKDRTDIGDSVEFAEKLRDCAQKR